MNSPLPEIHYDEWFADEPHNPLDDMPIATNDRFDMYGSSDADDAYNPRPEEEIAWDIEECKKAIRDAAEDYDKLVGG